MGNFGTAVNSLLGTYTKCLSLLKGFPKDEDSAILKVLRLVCGVAGGARDEAREEELRTIGLREAMIAR